MPSAMGSTPSTTAVPMGLVPRTSHRRGTARAPQQSTGSMSCHHTVPHHRSPVRGQEGLAAGHGLPSSPPKRHSSPFQQSTCGSAPVGLVSPRKKAKCLGEDKAACTSSQYRYLCGPKHLRRRLLPSPRSSGGASEEEKRTSQGRKKQYTHTRTPNSL